MSAPLTQGQRLAQEAAEAAEVRDWQDHPDVVALRVERIRTRIDRMMWAGIVIGLLFTMTSVQQFAAHAGNVGPGTLGWWAAWLLDPTVAVILLGILLAERVVAPARMLLGHRARVAKWGLLTATYVMNTWQSYAAGSPAGIVLHSVPVLAVFAAAESVTDCQDKLTAYVQWAHTAATERADRKAAAERAKQAQVDGDRAAENARLDQIRADEIRQRELAATEARETREHEARQLVGSLGLVLTLAAALRQRPTRPSRASQPRPSRVPTTRPTPVPVTDALLSQAQKVRAKQLSQGKTAGRAVLQRELGVPERTAKELARLLDEQQRPLHAVGGTS